MDTLHTTNSIPRAEPGKLCYGGFHGEKNGEKQKKHTMSNEKKLVVLGNTGDEILPSFARIINDYKDS